MISRDLSRRTIHVTASLSRNGGGIPPVIWSLAQQMRKLGGGDIVSGLKDEHFEADCSRRSVPVIAGTVRGPRSVGYSSELRRLLGEQVRPADILHVHGLWMYPGTLAFQLSRRVGGKRVVSPHGMLEPWALNNSRWKKRAAGWLFEARNLQSADCLHALCESEAESFRSYGLRNPIAIIPNGIELEALEPRRDKQVFLSDHSYLNGRRLLLFLSRVHPKKGLADLFRAWASSGAQKNDWSLLVVGPDELGHEAQLRALAGELKINEHIHFLGPAYGQKKSQMLAAADAFVLPSFSEGFSMAVLEAAAAGLPILLTRECNFPELAAAGAAIEVSAGANGILEGLNKLLQLDEPQRNLMGGKGFSLVKQSYAWPTIAAEMVRVYDWLAKTGPQPDCIKIG